MMPIATSSSISVKAWLCTCRLVLCIVCLSPGCQEPKFPDDCQWQFCLSIRIGVNLKLWLKSMRLMFVFHDWVGIVEVMHLMLLRVQNLRWIRLKSMIVNLRRSSEILTCRIRLRASPCGSIEPQCDHKKSESTNEEPISC